MNSSIRTAAFIIWTKNNRRWGQSESSYCIIRTSIIQSVTEHVGPTSYIVHLKTMKKVRMNLCSYLSSFVRCSGFSVLIFCYLITFAEDVQRDHLTFQGESVALRLVPGSWCFPNLSRSFFYSLNLGISTFSISIAWAD